MQLHLKRPLLVFSIVVLVVISPVIIYTAQVISQEGAPFETAKALLNLTIGGKDYSLINGSKYLLAHTNKKVDYNSPNKDNFCFYYEKFCKDLNLKYKDTFGAEIIFERDNKKIHALNTVFTRKYGVIDLDSFIFKNKNYN